MDFKFNIGSIKINTLSDTTEEIPKIDLEIKDVVLEYTDLSLPEYATLMKTLAGEAKELYKLTNGIPTPPPQRQQRGVFNN